MVRAHEALTRGERAGPWGFVLTAFAVSATLGAAGCGEDPPALTVGPVHFSASQLATVPPAALEELISITALTLATANDEIIERAGPLRDQVETESLAAALQREITLAAADVGDDQLRARYESAPAYELDVRHVVILADRALPDDQRAVARATAEEALDRARAGEDFGALAGELSEEPGAAERGGLLQPGREGTWVDEFWETAQTLSPGQLSPVIETMFGYHVLKLEARRAIPFDEMRDRVAADVASLLPSDAATAFVDSVTAAMPATSHLTTTLSSIARDRGLVADAGAVDQSMDDFRLQTLGWAAILGITDSSNPLTADPELLATRAMGALMATGQNATVARREIAARASLLRTFYPVGGTRVEATVAEPRETGGSQ